LGSLSAPPDHIATIWGPTSKERGGEEKGGKKMEREGGKGEEKEKEGRAASSYY